MPNLYNPSRDARLVKTADGRTFQILGRRRVYVSPSQMSASLWGMVRAGVLRNRGGDPKPPRPKRRSARPQGTSSSHHPTPAKVAAKSDDDSFENKTEKADKKQASSRKKRSATKTEVTDADSKPKRKRRKKSKKNG